MNEPIQSKSRGAIEAAWPLRVKNTTSEEVPPFAVMQVVSTSNTNQEEEYRVTKPTGSSGASYIINSPFPIAGNLFGSGTMGVATAAYNAALGTPTTGAEWGPVNGSWLLSPSGKGFTILGGAANGLVRVAPKGGATAGDDFPLVKIVNVSGLARSFGNIVGYGNSVDPPPATLSRIPTFQSAAPQAGQPFAVLLTDAGLNQTVDAGPVGVVPCQIYLNDANHKYAEAINNNYSWLNSAATGPALILWREKQGIVGSGTLGLQWARVRLDAEKFRLVRGEVYQSVTTSTTRFEIKNIKPLASGRDPRTNPTDAAERIWVANTHGAEYAPDDKIVAAYHENVIAAPTKTDWEALPKGGGPGAQIVYGITTGACPPATGNATSGPITPGTGGTVRIYNFGASYGSPANPGQEVQVENYVFANIAVRKPVWLYARPGAYCVISEACAAAP
jgi:hypothetical protein